MRIKVDKIDITLPDKIKILLVVGANNSGKTRFLEAIASTNSEVEVEFEGKVEVEFEGRTYKNHDNLPAYIVFGLDLDWAYHNVEQDSLRLASLLFRKYISDEILYIYKSDDDIRVVLNDFTDIPLNRLGRGYISTAYLMALYAHFSPSNYARFLFLIDSIEQYALDPILTRKFTEFLMSSNAITIASTTCSQMYTTILQHAKSTGREDDVMVLLLNRDKYALLTVDEALDVYRHDDLVSFAMKIQS